MARKFTAEEKAAAKAALKDAEGEKAVLEAIAKMADADRQIAERIHAIVRKVGAGACPAHVVRHAGLLEGRQGRLLLQGRRQVQGSLLDVRLQRQGEPRRRLDVADVVRR